MSHAAHDHEHPAHLQHHFETPAQQFDSGKLGIWLFLATEILMFGGLFVAYAVYRSNHPEIFLYAHRFLDSTLGGINTVVEPILGFFTSGTNGYYVSRTDREPFRIRPEDINGSQDLPLAILVDVDTVSFGEIFSGVLRTSGRAVIIGQNTLGNVEVLRAFSFDDGSRAWVAIANFEPVGEASGIWERTGIIPDYIVPTRWDLFTEATDPALAKAVEVLLGNK